MENWLDKHSRASMKLFDIVTELKGLAKCFRVTGNTDMHATLMSIAKELEEADREIRDAVGESLAESTDRAAESSKTLLKASLARIVLASKDR